MRFTKHSLQKTPGLAGEEPDHLELSLNTRIPEKPLRTQWMRAAWNTVWTAGEQLWEPDICKSVCYPQMVFIFKTWPFIFPVITQEAEGMQEALLSQKSSRWEEVWERRGDYIHFFLKIEISLQPEAVLEKKKTKNQTTLKK